MLQAEKLKEKKSHSVAHLIANTNIITIQVFTKRYSLHRLMTIDPGMRVKGDNGA